MTKKRLIERNRISDNNYKYKDEAEDKEVQIEEEIREPIKNAVTQKIDIADLEGFKRQWKENKQNINLYQNIFKTLDDMGHKSLKSETFTFSIDSELNDSFNKVIYDYAKRWDLEDVFVRNTKLRLGEILDYLCMCMENLIKDEEDFTPEDFDYFRINEKMRRPVKKVLKIRCKGCLDSIILYLHKNYGIKLSKRECITAIIRFVVDKKSFNIY